MKVTLVLNGIALGGMVLRRRNSAGSMPSLVGGEIDHALDHVARFRPAIAAIGPHRLGVREHRGDVDVRGRRAIDAGERAEIAGEGRHAGLQIGADRGDDLGAEAEKIAVLVERELGFGDVVARLRVAQEGFRARRHPFDRPAGQPWRASSTSATSL